MKTANSRYMAAMAFAVVAAAVPTIQAQILAPLGVNLGLTGEIIQSPVIHEPSDNAVGWSQTGWNFANRIVPVGQFMGFEDDGTAIPALDLIPFRSSSYTYVNPSTGVASAVPTSVSNGLSLVGSDVQLGGTLTKATTIAQAANDLKFTEGNVFFQPAGVTNPLVVSSGAVATSARLYSAGPIELQSGSAVQMVLTENGNVGIGTASPTHAKLSVIGSYTGSVGITGPTYAATYPNGHQGIVATGPFPSIAVGIFATGEIISSSVVRAPLLQGVNITVSSDRRIKDVIGVSDSSADLARLKEIKITDYKLKDRRLQNNQIMKKVIAQEVETVYPNAVILSNDRLPDVMQLATAKTVAGKMVDLELSADTDLKVGEKISILDQNDTPTVTTIEKIEGDKITVALEGVKTGDKRFVYGRQVDDFRTVDYDAISMLNVSATQELAKKVAALEAENAELKKIAAKVNKIEALERAVAALEGKTNDTVTVSLTK